MNLCMETLDTSSGAESSMDDGGGGVGTGGGVSTDNSHQTLAKQNAAFVEKNNTIENKKDKVEKQKGAGGDEGDPLVWEEFNRSFKQVQSVLDRNRLLIQKVNENHQSKIPDNLVKNVALIQEINGNISKVVSLYADLNSNFSSMIHRRNDDKNDAANGNAKDSSRGISQ